MESREAAAIEAFEQAEGQHTQRLKDFYLVTRARRRTLTLEDRECPMLGGISIATMEKNPSGDCGPAPTPPQWTPPHVISMTGSADGEEILPLT